YDAIDALVDDARCDVADETSCRTDRNPPSPRPFAVRLQHALRGLSPPDPDKIRTYPFEVEFLWSHQNHWMVFIVGSKEERVGRSLHQHVTLVDWNLEHRRVFMWAPPYPELAMRLERGLSVRDRFLDARQSETQCHPLEPV